MNVFMTGASGYVGGVVAERLLEAGHDVTGLARSPVSETTLHERGIGVVRGSITNLDTLRNCVRSADAIVYTAVEFSPAGFQEERRAVTEMLRASAGTGKPFLFTSGPGVLGNAADRLLDEDSPYNPWPLMEERVATEQVVLDAGNDRVRAVVIRPGMVYGRRGGNGAALYVETAARLCVAPYVRGTDAHWPVVHVDDLADLYVLALESSPAGSIVHEITGESVRLEDIAGATARRLGLPGGVAEWEAERIEQAFGAAGSIFTVNQRFAPSRAGKSLGWRPSRPGLLDELEHGSYGI